MTKSGGCTQKRIAELTNVSQSTVSRELARNGRPRSYDHADAQRKAEARKQWRHKPRKYKGKLKCRVHNILREWKSPEQICGVLAIEGVSLSHETIYADIRSDRKAGGDLYMFTRHKMKHRRRNIYANETPIPNRVDISQMPKEADGSRFGDWKMDLIVGARSEQAILTLTERKTNFSMLARLPNGKNSDDVVDMAYRMLLPFKKSVLTILTDNGPEFAKHEKLARKIGATVYFARPYHSWEKGAIEHYNKLLRQYIPKGSNFDLFSNKDLMNIQKDLNLRPRKKLGFISPKKAFFDLLSLYAVTT